VTDLIESQVGISGNIAGTALDGAMVAPGTSAFKTAGTTAAAEIVLRKSLRFIPVI